MSSIIFLPMSHTGVALFKGAAFAAPVAAEVVKYGVSTLLGEDTNLADSLHDAGYGLAWNLLPGKFIFEPFEMILKNAGSKLNCIISCFKCNYILCNFMYIVHDFLILKYRLYFLAVRDLLRFGLTKRKKTT